MQILEINIFCPIVKIYTNKSLFLLRVGETCAAFKVLVDEDTNKILGAHILGPHADEIINIFSIAIRLGLTTKDLNDPILYTYPTNSSDILYML